MRITNIDTLSALFDRLVSERIKLYHFETKIINKESAEHQRTVVEGIKKKLVELFTEAYESNNYNYIEERRTFGVDRIKEVRKLINNVEELTVNDLDVGAAYYEQKDGKPTSEKFMKNELKLREANEKRASSKNAIDKNFKKIVE